MEETQDVFGLGLSPGFKFDPDDDELVEQYLLRRILRQPLPLERVICEEDDLLSAAPWDLLKKHKREGDTFFFANGHTKHDKGNRQKRTCVGGCWEGQKPLVDGERLRVPGIGGTDEITWRKYMLNFHREGEKGSTGWVMHEYSITGPDHLASSSQRLYRIRLSGHGKNSRRERGEDGGALVRIDGAISAANSVFPAAEVVDDEDGGSAWPPTTSYSDQVYQYEYGWSFPGGEQERVDDEDDGSARSAATSYSDQVYDYGWSFPGVDAGGYGGPGATPDQGAPGVMNEYGGAAPAVEMLPFNQGSFSGDESVMDFELPDQQDFNIDDEFTDFELPDQLNFSIDELLGFQAPSAGSDFGGFRRYISNVPKIIVSKTSTGYAGMIKVREFDRNISMDQGWASFSITHEIKIGYLLTFKALKKDAYKVIIFDYSMTEIVKKCSEHDLALAKMEWKLEKDPSDSQRMRGKGIDTKKYFFLLYDVIRSIAGADNLC
ncbi:hypothetical protein QYE76_051245 [Lolium multiflorum]|uniref:NAC domain-containing protein n=1 Tax=Lolium multiflorum TaxID=4521 RepID=A0AAD8WII7_LOLMU|nr:hypothetical protein QYE76_051245 [Lolium multiflorum]